MDLSRGLRDQDSPATGGVADSNAASTIYYDMSITRHYYCYYDYFTVVTSTTAASPYNTLTHHTPRAAQTIADKHGLTVEQITAMSKEELEARFLLPLQM
jgi:hypothetical protein